MTASRRGWRSGLEAAVAEGLEAMVPKARALRGPLVAFRDLVLADATVMRLKDLLAGVYPACRTNHTQAAVKLHAVVSVTGASRQAVKLTDEREHEARVFQVGPWVRGRLLLFDPGFFRYQLFACITRNGGYFLARLKRHANPRIVAVHRRHRGRALALVGERLQDVLARLQREVIDVEVEVIFPRRQYRDHVHRDRQRLRVVGLKDPASGEHHLYCTNVPPEKLSAEDVRGAYAAILTFTVSRRLREAVRAKLKHFADRMPEQRWARLFAAVAHDLLLLMTRPPRETRLSERLVSILLLHEAVDPNRDRPSLIHAVESRRHAYRPRTA